MTPAEIQQAIAANTQAITDLSRTVNFLVTEAIRPAVQQSSANYERLESIVGIVADSAQQIAQNSQALSSLVELSTANQQQVASNTQAITMLTRLAEGNQQRLDAFDSRLEETRAIVADNGSQIAQIGVKVDANAEQIAQLQETVEASRQETEALKEITRTQLAGIIANGRRIDRLEQQAS